MLECFACSRRFKKPPQLFGHLRQCPWHKQRRQNAKAKAKARKQPPGKTHPGNPRTRNLGKSSRARAEDDKPLSRRPGRDSQESLRLMLNVFEALPLLTGECSDHVVIVRQLASAYPDITSPQQWEKLYWMLDTCERDFEQMVFRFRLDPALLFAIYRTMLGLKTRWLNYRANDRTAGGREETHEENLAHFYAEEEKWTPILSHLKDMIVASC